MAINVLVRGQSNALLFDNYGGADVLRADLEARLGQPVNLIAGDGETLFSATRFMDWDTDGQQAAVVRAAQAAPDASATAVVWLHNEYDQQGSFTSAEWEAEVRADAALVRGALGQGAADVPYIFVPVKYPYGGNFGAIEEGMKRLDADASFNASISWDATSLRMDGGPEAGANSSHMGWQDAQDLGHALADDVAAALAAAPPPPPATPSPTTPEAPVANADAFDTVLRDDFSQGYKTENWGQPFNGGTYWNGAWSWSGSDVNVRDGAMEVTMTRHADGWWTGGGFNSFKAGNTITYGKFEFDGRVDEAQGTMGVFLTWPASDKWPVDGEIDILETPHGNQMFSTHYQGPDGGHWYDSKTSDTYDETQWQHYDVLWLPDYLGIKVGDQVVAEWTNPAEIPDVAHGLGAMGMVGAPSDGWIGGAPDGSTPGVVRAQMDNVVMRQWNGADVDVAAWKAGGAQPAPGPVQPPAPTQPAPGPMTGGSGPDHLQLWVSEHAYQGDAQFTVKVDGVQVGGTFTATHAHGQSAQAVDLRGDWAAGPHEVVVEFVNDHFDANADWSVPALVTADRNLFVNGALINGEAIVGAEQAVMTGSISFGFTDKTGPATPPPVAAPPVVVPPVVAPPVVTPPGGPASADIEGGLDADTISVRLSDVSVSGGGGGDLILLRAGHENVSVVMNAGEASDDEILGFTGAGREGGDVLAFHGYGAGAELVNLGYGDFAAVSADGAVLDVFTMPGVDDLVAGDYLFA